MGNILLVLAHADSVVKGAIGRRDALLALFGVMNKLDRRERALLKCLKCLRLLTFDPALLQPLQVRPSRLPCLSLAALQPHLVFFETRGTPRLRC